jgi:hypothetical protein
MIAALIAATAANPGLGSRAALPESKTTDPFEAFKASQARVVKRRAPWNLSAIPSSPLRVGHFEQIDLWNCTSDVEQRINSAKAVKSARDGDIGRSRVAQIERVDKWFGSGGHYISRCSLQRLFISGNEDEPRKIAREAHGGSASDALTCSGDESNRLVFIAPSYRLAYCSFAFAR